MGLNGLESCGNRVDDVTRGCQVSGRRDVNINQWNVKTHWVVVAEILRETFGGTCHSKNPA